MQVLHYLSKISFYNSRVNQNMDSVSERQINVRTKERRLFNLQITMPKRRFPPSKFP
jgi:hypothetical protein